MLDVPRLTVARQRRVAQALQELAGDKNASKSLHAEVRAALAAVVPAGARLDGGRELPPLVLDTTTDAVFAAFDDLLEAIENGLTDRVIKPLTPEQAAKKAAARLLRHRVFPDGAGFLQKSMPLQYKGMRDAVDALDDKDCAAAVKELGIGWFIQHLTAHLGPYGRAVKTADDRDLEAASDAFHAAFVDLAVKTLAHHGDSGDARKQVFGAYETELAAQRADEREARRRAAARKKGEPID